MWGGASGRPGQLEKIALHSETPAIRLYYMKSHTALLRLSAELGILIALAFLLASCLSPASSKRAEETPAETAERIFGALPHSAARFQSGNLSMLIPPDWVVRRKIEEGNLIIDDSSGRHMLEIYSIESRQGVNASTAGEYLARSLDSPIGERFRGRCSGYEAVYLSLEDGRSILAVDLIDSLLVSLSAKGAGGILPYLKIGEVSQEIRTRSSYSFHSLDSPWLWFGDTEGGFVLGIEKRGELSALFGDEAPSRYSKFFSEETAESSEGRIRKLVDSYPAEIVYRSFVEGESRHIALRIEMADTSHYALIQQNGFELEVEDLLATERYTKLFSSCIHFGAPYSAIVSEEIPGQKPQLVLTEEE